jgi:hypothetical protein
VREIIRAEPPESCDAQLSRFSHHGHLGALLSHGVRVCLLSVILGTTNDVPLASPESHLASRSTWTSGSQTPRNTGRSEANHAACKYTSSLSRQGEAHGPRLRCMQSGVANNAGSKAYEVNCGCLVDAPHVLRMPPEQLVTAVRN